MANPLSRTVMVTGSSRGLGLEIVRQLAVADNPPKVIIATCRNPDKATELQALARDHQQIKVIKFDVVDYKSLPSVVEEVKAAVGSLGLNLLVNNAGIMEKCSTQMFGVPLQDLEPQMFRNVLETNTIAPLMLIKALLPQLRVAAAATSGPAGAPRAMVVNISSIMASMGTFLDRHGIYAYRSSKTALNMVTKILAEDPEMKGLLFVAIHPGWVRTDMGTTVAPLRAEDSVSQMLRVVANINEKQNGVLLNYDGSVLPW
ncbi:hypothetical protein O3P69_001071 [Scylla paramamosain]|uniref:C-factor n=1 Tax=Scylla paramamosain TaxID=85552 RepID=A0AAW0UNG0_SCYPA